MLLEVYKKTDEMCYFSVEQLEYRKPEDEIKKSYYIIHKNKDSKTKGFVGCYVLHKSDTEGNRGKFVSIGRNESSLMDMIVSTMFPAYAQGDWKYINALVHQIFEMKGFDVARS